MIILLIITYFTLICYGLTSIVVQSKLLKPFREWVKTRSVFFGSLFSCMMCFGFWVGLIMVTITGFSPSFVFFSQFMLTEYGIEPRIVFYIFDAAFLSSIIYNLNLLELYIESKLPDEQ